VPRWQAGRATRGDSSAKSAISDVVSTLHHPRASQLGRQGGTMQRAPIALVVALGLAAAGCASGEEWRTWQSHPSHFASWTHLDFSVQRPGEDGLVIQDRDMTSARNENWWGQGIPDPPPPLNLTGTWRGAWRGVGLFNTPRSAEAEATFAQIGSSGTGRLCLHDTLAAEVPSIVTQGGSSGLRVAYTVSGGRVTVRDASDGRALHVVLMLDRERLVGTIVNHGAPVSLVLTRVSY
jgi:hypothetical protein